MSESLGLQMLYRLVPDPVCFTPSHLDIQSQASVLPPPSRVLSPQQSLFCLCHHSAGTCSVFEASRYLVEDCLVAKPGVVRYSSGQDPLYCPTPKYDGFKGIICGCRFRQTLVQILPHPFISCVMLDRSFVFLFTSLNLYRTEYSPLDLSGFHEVIL